MYHVVADKSLKTTENLETIMPKSWCGWILREVSLQKKVMSNSLGLMDFAIGLVNSVINLPDGQVKFF